MAQLRQDYDQIKKRNAVVLVIGPEDSAAFADYWGQNDLPFIGLPDPTHSVLKLYGQKVNIFKLGRMPAQVIVDKSGTARFIKSYGVLINGANRSELITKLKRKGLLKVSQMA